MTSISYSPIDSRHDVLSRKRRTEGLDAKIVVLGNSGVGKTSLLQRFVQDNFDPAHTHATTSAFFAAKRVYVDNQKVKLQLWDTAGQERFRSMAPIYYRGANAALLLYDITDYSSFESLKTWLQELKKNCTPDLIIYIVGAKADLYRQRQVSTDRIRLSLHHWFPPPRPPTPPPAPSAPHSYIRPRFTSLTNLTTSHSVPFLSSRTRTKSQIQPPPAHINPPLRRSNTFLSSTTNDVAPRNLSSERNNRKANEDLENSWLKSSLNGVTNAESGEVFTELKQDVHFHFPKHQYNQVFRLAEELVENDNDEFAPEWGVEENMRLFEVSAKDDQGVRELFDTLIRAIIAKREVIEQNREMQERNSVYLTNTALTPTWAPLANEEEARLAEANKWRSCC